MNRFRTFWLRHRTLFWTLHSLWALATGLLVVWLARERYSFVPWVVLLLVLTWASTLYFGRRIPDAVVDLDSVDGGAAARASPGGEEPGLREEATSYLTRTMYQETLFFLLPFYAYSTVVGSVNMVFVVGLAALAFVSCIDLVFDRWLRSSPVASVTFFAVVAFAALNLLIPILLPVPPSVATGVAVVVAVLSAVPLAHASVSWDRRSTLRVGGAVAGLLAIGLGVPQVVPPVPLRMESTVFSADFQRESLTPLDTLDGEVELSRLDGAIVVLMEVFAPTVVPVSINLVWRHDGIVIAESRDIEIVAHDLGFRVWDAWRPTNVPLRPGRYEVILRTSAGRMFGRSALSVLDR